MAAGQHPVDLADELFAPVFRVVHRPIFTGKLQRAGNQRFIERVQQRTRHRMRGHANADGLAPFVGNPLRQFLARVQDEGVGPGRCAFQQPELGIVDPCIAGDLRKVTTHQGELVVFVEVADAAQSIGRRTVIQMAAQGIAGLGGIGDDCPAPHRVDHLPDETGLRVFGVQVNPARGHQTVMPSGGGMWAGMNRSSASGPDPGLTR